MVITVIVAVMLLVEGVLWEFGCLCWVFMVVIGYSRFCGRTAVYVGNHNHCVLMIIVVLVCSDGSNDGGHCNHGSIIMMVKSYLVMIVQL
jgi:hypothetical protein